MTTRALFIGDEISAAGYHIAGARILTPPREEPAIVSALEQARSQADLVLITQEYANALSAGVLESALAALSPLLVVVADARERVPLADIGSRLRGQLGVEE